MSGLRRTIITGIALLAWGLASTAQSEPITIGVVGPLSGPAANSGIAMQQAFRYIVEEANQDGGIEINGEKRQIELLFEDDQSQPSLGVSAATKLLTRDQVDILIGDMFHSSVTLAIMDLAPSFSDTFFMSGQPVSINIAQRIKENPKKLRNFWKANFNSDAYGEAVWKSISALVDSGKIDAGDKRIAFISQDDDYGRSNIEYVRRYFEEAGWTEAMYGAVPLGHSEFYPQLDKLKADPPDVLVSVFSVVNSGIALVKQMQEKQLNVPHMAIYYPLRPEFQKAVGDEVANHLLWTPLFLDAAHNEKHAEFAEKFEAAMDVEATGDHAQGACHMGMLLDNIRKAGSVEVDALVAAFENTDYRCVLGRWVFNNDTHTPKVGPEYYPIPAAQIQDGESFVVWPEEIATADYQSPSE